MIKIKVPVTKEQRGWIEQSVSNYEKALIRDQKEFIKEQKRRRSKIKRLKNFWATNTIPIEPYHSSRKIINENNFYETQLEYKLNKGLNINVLKRTKSWVCKFCKEHSAAKYICVGSHRDYHYDVCDCEGARKTGKNWKDLN